MVDKPPATREIAQLAARQHGHVTRGQLRALGLGEDAVDHRIGTGELVRVHAGVYAVSYRRVEPVARAMAAVLACGRGAVLSHDSALALWDLRRWPQELELIVPGRVRRPGLLAHRSTTLNRTDITVQLGVPTTRAARALHDMKTRLTAKQLTRLTNQARLAHILTEDEAERLLHHRRNPTRSGLEDEFQRWLERYDLPQPVINARPGGHEIDARYPEQRLIVEVDDYATHGDPASFQSDRDRDFDHLVDLDHATIRLTRERFDGPTAERLHRLLRARDRDRDRARDDSSLG